MSRSIFVFLCLLSFSYSAFAVQNETSKPLTLAGFPSELHYTAKLSGLSVLPKSKFHKITVSYYQKTGEKILYKESFKNISLLNNQMKLNLGSGKQIKKWHGKKLQFSSLQGVFAHNREIDMQISVDGIDMYPKIGILPAGHSQETALLLSNEKSRDNKHWKGFNSKSTQSFFQSATLSPEKNVFANNVKKNPYEVKMNGPFLSIPVRDMPLATQSNIVFQAKETNALRHENLFDKDGFRYGTKSPKMIDALAEKSKQNPAGFFTPVTNLDFPGMSNSSGVYPPDTEGAVGVNYYVQMVNSTFEIYNKSDGSVAQAARNTNTLWSAHGGRCQSDNSGDAIALYDEQAGRWVLTQFAVAAAPESVCFAISVTGDPTGAYYTYDFATARFPDYYKLGVWPATGNNAYFMGTNSGGQNQYDVYAIDRENMLLGLAARPAQFFQSYPNLLMPADNDGDNPPPANAPGLLYTIRDAGEAYFGSPANDSIDVYEFNVDWTTPSNTTFTLAQVITNADGLTNFNWTVCGFFVSNCIPQPGTSVLIDSNSWWPQQRLQYRNFGGFETLVGVWGVNAVVAPAKHTAPRWFELRRNIGAGSWGLRQEGTYAPDSDHRFSPSISMDASENIALGYSVTSSTTFPSIRYTVHDESVDPLGVMEPEVTMVAGGGSQTGSAGRWGDYASMEVDPVDDCTFWFTTEYYTSTSSVNWETRIGSFKVPTCKNYLVTAANDNIKVCKADDTAAFNLSLSNDFNATTNMTLSGCPTGASCSFSPNPVVNPVSATALNLSGLSGVTGGSHVMTATATDSVDALATSSIDLTLFLFNGNPGTPVLSSPTNGSFVDSLGPNLSWSAVTDGQDYFVEVDNDPAFGSIDFSTTVNGGLTSTSSSGLSENTCYYWRVTPSNLCGTGTTSSVFDFYTGAAQTTANFASTDVPKTIATVPVSVPSTLTIAGVGVISDVNVVGIDITHSYVGDLTLTLQSPSGTVVTIMNVGCGTDNNININLDDEAAGTWGCAGGGPVGGGGTFQPSNPLSAFDGEDANGVWTLTVIDGFNLDGGSLNGWGLNFVNFADTGNYCNVTPTYTVGGSVSGLVGSGLVLQNNAGDNLSIAANGSFTFATALADLSSYSVSVLTQPSTPSQSCTVSNGSGTLSGANVTNVSITCTTNSYTIGGSVSGLTGSGLVLQNNAGDNLPIAANGSFTFATPLSDLSPYAVTVLTQPSSPNQTCTLSNASGNLAGANITNVSVSCSVNTYTVGGNVSGLSGSGLVLQNNLGDNLPIAANGSFTFSTALLDLATYSVTVLTQPSSPAQVCNVTNGSGAIASANVTNVSISCSNLPDITFSGTNLTQDVCVFPAGPTAMTPVTLTTTALSGFSNAVNLAFNPALPTGISGGFSTNNFIPSAAPGTDSILNLDVSNAATAGLNNLTIEATGTGISTKSVGLNLTVIFGLSSSPVVSVPTSGGTGVATTTSFTWAAISGANSYDIDISTDPTFTTVDYSATVTGTNYTPGAALNNATLYYWRVRATNTCGSTSYTFSAFETVAGSGITTTTYCSAANLGITIPDNDPAGANNVLNIPATGTITDINISLDISHTWVGDLDISITSPNPTSIVVFDRPGYTGTGNGCSRNNINTTLDDAAGTPVEGVCPNVDPTIGAGPFSPNNPLSGFNTQSVSGNWTIQITDNANQDIGTLNQWCVIATVDSGASLTPADYSDLNSSYGVAKHEGGGAFKLGNNWTADTIFSQDSDVIDDDGITASGDWSVGSSSAMLAITPNQAGFVSCWFDWNNDGTFIGDGNGISQSVTAGTNNIAVSIPASSTFGSTGDDFLETRCRLYDVVQVRAPASPTGTATAGEVEDYRLPAATLTPVSLTFASAVSRDSAFSLDWSTTTESGTIGFNVYGFEKNAWRKLNVKPIQAQGINSVIPHDYHIDLNNASINSYKIEELTAWGEKIMYGPYASNLNYGKYPNKQSIAWKNINKQSKDKKDLSKLSNKATIDFVKVRVNKSGAQRITYEDLLAQGVDWQGVNADDIAIVFENNKIARKISDAVFTTGSYIDFIGNAADTLYTKTNIYEIKLDKSMVKDVISNSNTGFAIDASTYYMALANVNQDVKYSVSSPSDNPWYMNDFLVFTTQKDFSFIVDLPYLIDNGNSLNFSYSSWGATDWPQSIDHHLQVLVNGEIISDQLSEGVNLINDSTTLDFSQVLNSNTVVFRMPADTGVDYDLIQLDGFAIQYPAALFSNNDHLTFVPLSSNPSVLADTLFKNSFESSPAKGQFKNAVAQTGFVVEGFSSADIKAYASDGVDLYEFPQALIQQNTNGYNIQLPNVSSGGIHYYLTTDTSINTPVLETGYNNSIDLSQSFDYLMIVHPDFMPTISQLADYHRNKGLNVKVVDVNDIYAQYSYHRKDAFAIKKFIKEAYTRAKIKSVLLVGSDSYDYFDNLAVGSISFIPTLYRATGDIITHAPVDSLFADVNDDLIPDITIGRLPVRTPAELQNMINKIQSFDLRAYGNTAVFASDRNDVFDEYSNQMGNLLPQDWLLEKAYITNNDITGAQSILVNSINTGVSLTSFFGHSGPTTWSFEHLFDNTDVLNLNNLGKPTIISQFGCWNTYYVMPQYNTMAQSLMGLDNKGAVAVYGASTLTDSSHEAQLGLLLIPKMTQTNQPIGQALLNAKTELALTHPEYLDVILGWNLLGDPMTGLNN